MSTLVAQDKLKVAWILGAGFSIPLGGPLFRELISDKTLKQLRTWKDFAAQTTPMNVPQAAPHTFHGKAIKVITLASIVSAVYKAGFGGTGTLGLWGDAEQFLDILEIASSEPGEVLAAEFERLLALVKSNLREEGSNDALLALGAKDGLALLHREAVRYVAAACTVFLLRVEGNPSLVRESELWSPYRRWVEKLEAVDAVITFNYDRVLNLLNEYLVTFNKGKPRQRPVLDSPIGSDLELFHAASNSTVPMYHLHGHVGWQKASNGSVLCGTEVSGMRSDPARAHLEPDLALLGTPGKHKTSLPTGILQDGWRRAMDAISNANSIVFVGYRFPETDNVAKQQLADALRNNPTARVHIVLGAHNPDLPRLKGMIEWTRDKHVNPVHVHEMWCQDFFSVFERQRL